MTTRDLAMHRADLLLAQYDEGHHVERPADHLAAAVAVVRELRVALADYEADAIHTCGPECRRPLCVLRAELNAEQQKYADLFQAMQHPSYEEENRLRAELAASRAELADTKETLDRVREASRDLREADAHFLRVARDEARQCREELWAQRAELADAIATEELHAAHDKEIIDRLQGELAELRAQEPVAWGITDKNKAVSLTFSKGFANHWKEAYPTLKVYDFYAAPTPAAVADARLTSSIPDKGADDAPPYYNSSEASAWAAGYGAGKDAQFSAMLAAAPSATQEGKP